jgi:hypothetical protein
MAYVEGQTIHDADSHIMELPGALNSFIDPNYRAAFIEKTGAGGAGGAGGAADAGEGANAVTDEDEAEYAAAEAAADASGDGGAKAIEIVPVDNSAAAPQAGLAEPAGPRSHAVSHTHLGALAHLNSMHSMRSLQLPPEAPPRSFATQEELNWRRVRRANPTRPSLPPKPTHL